MIAKCSICWQPIRPSLVLSPHIQLPPNTAVTDFARIYFSAIEHFQKSHTKEMRAIADLTMVWVMWSHTMLLLSDDAEFLAARQSAQETLAALLKPVPEDPDESQ